MTDKSRLKFERARQPLIISKFGKLVLLILVIVLGIGYASWQLFMLVGPPRIHIISPSNGEKVSEPFVRFKGSASKGSRVSINGSSIPLETNGDFDQNIPLKPGLNKLYIHTANRSGRTATVVRIVEAKLDLNRGEGYN